MGQIGLSRSIGSFVSRHRSLILISSQGLDQIATLISTRAGNLAQDSASTQSISAIARHGIFSKKFKLRRCIGDLRETMSPHR